MKKIFIFFFLLSVYPDLCFSQDKRSGKSFEELLKAGYKNSSAQAPKPSNSNKFVFPNTQRKSSGTSQSKQAPSHPVKPVYAERIFKNPFYENKDCGGFFISEIWLTKEATIIKGKYNNMYGTWANIDSETILYDPITSNGYFLQKTEGLPIAPQVRLFKKDFEDVEYTLYFDPLPLGIHTITLLENIHDDNAFNVYDIDLTGKQLPKESEFHRLPQSQNASFPGGEEACVKWLSDHIKYPTVCQEQGIQGRVIVSFVVDKSGDLIDLEVVRTPDSLLSQEAVRVIKSMPRWNPATINQKPVKSRFNLPVLFRLTE